MAKGTEVAPNVTEATDEEGWETVVEPYGETYSFETPGDALTGTFVGSKTVATEDLNNPGNMRDQTVYEIVDANQKKWTVWSSHNIDAGLADVAEGTLVRIRFDGKVNIGNGRSVKQFTIQTKR